MRLFTSLPFNNVIFSANLARLWISCTLNDPRADLHSNRGKVTFGIAGMVGKLGNRGKVGLGKEDWVIGMVGNVGCGRVGIVGNAGFGKLDTNGKGGNGKRLQVAKPRSMLENDKVMKKGRMK
ncbi:hypothetical protein GH714_003447 [Hevea brasiliensis]|uniref:Uncharacterized protein n=1 Tax=Hevea brasiliensis TaxID=3981 RepID=A0A6A6MYP1_HEVBR|nr:hypothetical protein GH714_003411 [Hevea brasiliensis]KAF2318237.1 hypothetical protein GH714_003447 [Hevea brasiliensis]